MLKMPGQSTKVCSLKAKPTAFNSASSVDCESESRGDREGDSLMSAIGCIIYLTNFLSSHVSYDYRSYERNLSNCV